MSMPCRIPTGFKRVYHYPGQINRWCEPTMELYLPPANIQMEPMSDYGTIWTAEGFARIKIGNFQ
jgi:hypothetical protein